MRNIAILVKKEFRQLKRNKAMLPIIFVMPIFQLLVLVNAATFEVKSLKLAFIDDDRSSSSRLLIDKFVRTDYFKNSLYANSIKEAEQLVKDRKVDFYLHIPMNFEQNLVRNSNEKLMLIINAIDGTKAGIAQNYAQSIISEFGSELKQNFAFKVSLINQVNFKQINPIPTIWYNPFLNYKIFMVPGILVLLVTMIGAFLSAMNVVREKEMGTMEQINVTPIKKYEFIIGKLVPFWLIGMFELGFGLFIASLVYHIPIVGSLFIVFSFAALYLLGIQGLGLLISTISETQQQAMFLTWFFMVIFILLSGLFTPIENMPSWTQYLTYFNPIRYFIEVIRMVLLKGSSFSDVKVHYLIVVVFAIVLNTIAVLRYRKTV